METQSIEVSYFRVGHILIPKVWAENFTSVRLITKVLWVKLGNGLLKKLKMVVKKIGTLFARSIHKSQIIYNILKLQYVLTH
jgi:hypothetical protein